ncbi:Holliday junction DNA helicase RuvA [Microbacteriaceae bacterium SG_E_30_P1]|uniref:Holliday junction branch migration complex subunit RuvA n=1 Tax=Antiquaquibacter oligotrophicus TaxID=2880260 RepID=A0ABT6KLW0_9MICO|nr:Holliday junction branch migration protein RuvA [Antiquaquibacter oligotrophicus]MDH6181006.1 Holliday junction DNA helicase RuvA [Antiquaquibacter oligotrophicus]UDF13294.1 Holliday junction branch migration protein RuvA [Antiquaquibacter oligotrophicus]
MIASVRGSVLVSAGTTVVIDVGGVGLSISTTPQNALALRVGMEATVHTALIVREDDLSLFGFATKDELDVFDLLRGVTGVGPKSALGVLATMTPAQIASAVDAEDDAAFRKVPGIGPKTAKLIIVSLAGKLAVASTVTEPVSSTPSSARDDVAVALVGLGWPERVAASAVEDALAVASAAEKDSVPALLRIALASLGPRS